MPRARPTQADVERLKRQVAYYKSEYRRICEEIDWRDEKIRVLQRVIERLARSNT